MNWGIIGAITGAIGVSIAGLTWLANRRAARVLAPRIEGQSYLHGDVVHTLFKIAGPNAEHWTVSSVRVSGTEGMVAPWLPGIFEDGYGNSLYGPGAWDSYLNLAEYRSASGIGTTPSACDVHLVFDMVAKSDRNQTSAFPYTVKALTPPAGVHPT